MIQINTSMRLACALAVLVLLPLASQEPGEAQAPASRAAVVIRFGEGQTVVRTVRFTGPSLTGFELLQASGLALGGQGGTVCSIGPTGCPLDDCWCHCNGSTPGCTFWNYFHWTGTLWNPSGVGPGTYTVGSGEIDGWSWGSGTPPSLVEPAVVFDSARFAPGVPELQVAGTSADLRLDFQGDDNQNGIVVSHFREAGGSWASDTITLTRGVDSFHGQMTGLSGGIYVIGVDCSDPDGVNGSATWILTATVTTAGRLYLPLLIGKEP